MKYIISYDITKDKYRKDLSDFLISEGFIRIQKSIFLGNIEIEKVSSIIRNCKKYLDYVDSIIVIPICIEDLQKSYFLGITFDLEDLEKFKEFIFF